MSKRTFLLIAVILILPLVISCYKVEDLTMEDLDRSDSSNSSDNSAVHTETSLKLTDPADFSDTIASDYPFLTSLDLNGLALDDFSAIDSCQALKWLDLRGCNVSLGQFTELCRKHPDCEIAWDVPIGSGRFDSTSESIALPADSAAELARLTYLPSLTHVDARAVTDQEWLSAARTVFPDIAFEWTVPVLGTEVDGSTDFLDLTAAEEVSPESLSNLDYLDNLKVVDLRGRSFSMDEMNALADRFPNIEFLFSFTLAGVETDGTAESLDISGRYIGSVDDLRARLRFMKRLTYLDMCRCGLNNDTMAKLREDFPNIKFVWMIYMGQYSLRTDAISFSTLVGFDDYTHLYSSSIEVLKYCTDLEALDLGHHYVRDLSVLQYLPKLRVLILADNRITDLTPIASLKELRYLEIFMNYNLQDISPLAELPNLIDLNMSYLAEVDDLSPLYGLEHLERIWLNRCDTPPERLEELKANIPENCVVFCSEIESATGGGWRDNERHWMQRDMFRHNYIDPWFYENP